MKFKLIGLGILIFFVAVVSGCIDDSQIEECKSNCEYLDLGFFEMEDNALNPNECWCYHKESKDLIEIWESQTIYQIRKQKGVVD